MLYVRFKDRLKVIDGELALDITYTPLRLLARQLYEIALFVPESSVYISRSFDGRCYLVMKVAVQGTAGAANHLSWSSI